MLPETPTQCVAPAVLTHGSEFTVPTLKLNDICDAVEERRPFPGGFGPSASSYYVQKCQTQTPRAAEGKDRQKPDRGKNQ